MRDIYIDNLITSCIQNVYKISITLAMFIEKYIYNPNIKLEKYFHLEQNQIKMA
jgi:hypothetical protein